MTGLPIGGRRFAAGLDWLARSSVAQTAHEARKGGSAWCVYLGDQTGYAGASDDHEVGMPALAAVLKGWIEERSWMALVRADDGRCALIQVRDGGILASGDRVFESVAAAIGALEGVDRSGWVFYATPDTLEGAREIDVSALRSEDGLRPAPLSGVTRKKVMRGLAAVAAAGVMLTVWGLKDRIVLLVLGPPKKAEVAEKEQIPQIAAVVDSVALVAGCREGIRRYTPGMPGWQLKDLSCVARFDDGKLLAVRPALKDRPVLVVRWGMRRNSEEALHRQVADRHLREWKSGAGGGTLEGSVVGREAWVVVGLPPVAVEANGALMPSRLALRTDLDRKFGLRAVRIEHARKAGMTRIVMREPLLQIAQLVEGVAGFEVLKLARGNGGWVIEGRRAKPVRMEQPAFARLRSFIE